MKQKLRENGEYWGERVDSLLNIHQEFEKDSNKSGKIWENYGKIVFRTKFSQNIEKFGEKLKKENVL